MRRVRRDRRHLAGPGAVPRNDRRREHRHSMRSWRASAARRIIGDAQTAQRPRSASWRRPRRRCASQQSAIAQRQIVAIARALVSEAPALSSWTSRRRRSPKRKPIGCLILCGRSRLAASLSSSSATVWRRCWRSRRRVTVLRDGRLVGVFGTAGMTQSRLTELMTGKTFDKEVAAQDTTKQRSCRGRKD